MEIGYWRDGKLYKGRRESTIISFKTGDTGTENTKTFLRYKIEEGVIKGFNSSSRSQKVVLPKKP